VLLNPGFELGEAFWSSTTGVITNNPNQAARSGIWKAWLCGSGAANTDTVSQSVTIPSTASSATLSFWLHVDTNETSTTTAFDTLRVQIRNATGTVILSTLATYSNLNSAPGYSLKTFNLNSFRGQTIRVYIEGVENSTLQTSFVIDDTALIVQ
jgi:hypothetical protein